MCDRSHQGQLSSTDRVSGLIKTDSRTILDANGAEALLGRGDMLYLASGTGKLMRIHGSFVSDDDVRRVVEFVKKQALPSYCRELQSLKIEEAEEEQAKDEVYEQAKDLSYRRPSLRLVDSAALARGVSEGGTHDRTDGGGRRGGRGRS